MKYLAKLGHALISWLENVRLKKRGGGEYHQQVLLPNDINHLEISLFLFHLITMNLMEWKSFRLSSNCKNTQDRYGLFDMLTA